MRRYKAVFRDVRGNTVRTCTIMSESQTDAYWQTLGHAIAAGVWPNVEVRTDG